MQSEESKQKSRHAFFAMLYVGNSHANYSQVFNRLGHASLGNLGVWKPSPSLWGKKRKKLRTPLLFSWPFFDPSQKHSANSKTIYIYHILYNSIWVWDHTPPTLEVLGSQRVQRFLLETSNPWWHSWETNWQHLHRWSRSSHKDKTGKTHFFALFRKVVGFLYVIKII